MRYSLFGESHGPAVGIVLQGLPAGLLLDMDLIAAEMARRAPGRSPLATARREEDTVEIMSGVFEGRCTGMPLCALIRNADVRPRDYEATRWTPRPSHADHTAHLQGKGFEDYRGGGHFSGRLTAPLVFAGAVAKMALREHGIEVLARIRQIEGIEDIPLDLARPDLDALRRTATTPFPAIDEECGRTMQEAILRAREEGDSVGGIIECFVLGLPAGLGGPDFDENVESCIARHIFAVPGVKGLDFGTGFGLAAMRGSQANDAFLPGPNLHTATNHSGGINGGITSAMPLVFRVVVKPTPSIAREQASVDMRSGEAASLTISGRHDPCIVPRAVPVIEAAAALAMTELPGVLA